MSTIPQPDASKSGGTRSSSLRPLMKSLSIISSPRDTGDLSQDAEEQRSLDLQNRIDAIIAIVDAQLTELPDQQRQLIKDNVRTALIEGGKNRGLRSLDAERGLFRSVPARAPVRELTSDELANIKEVGERHPWEERPRGVITPVDWVRKHYARWVPGLTTSHLSQVDPPFYKAFMQHVSRHGLPEDIDIPTKPENELRRGPAPPAKQDFSRPLPKNIFG